MLEFERWLNAMGRDTGRYRYPGGLSCDLFDLTTTTLYESKSHPDRDHLRYAVGQLFDYRRHHTNPAHVNLTVLLPTAPSGDLADYLNGLEIAGRYKTPDGFTQTNAGTTEIVF